MEKIINLQLCGTSKGGISIGRENTEDYSSPSYIPKFESHFPTVFYDGIYGIDNYSLDEVYTGSKWINGKKIYKKTFAKAATQINGSTTYKENGRIENIDEVINIEGIAYSATYQFPIPYESAAESASNRYTRGAFIRVTDESDAENHDGIVYYIKQTNSDITNMMATVWYTKTTD